MKRIATATAGLFLAGMLAACGSSPQPGNDGEYPEFDHEHRQACYTPQGKFKKYDDDCYDDGLLTRRERDLKFPKPLRTSAGMQTAGPVKMVTPPKVVTPVKPPVKAPVTRPKPR